MVISGITVGNKTANTSQRDSNTVIDSGTTFTFLPTSFYNDVEALVEAAVGVEATPNPPKDFNLCFAYDSIAPGNSNDFDFVVHFENADLSLNPQNIFVRVDDFLCFAVFPTNGVPFYGNVAQIDFQVEYDLEERKVSFAPADCTQH